MIVACDDVVMDGAEVAVGVGEGVAVAILIGAGVGVGVGAAAITTPRVLPPSCVKLYIRRKWWSGTSRLKVEFVITTVLISPAAKAVSAERKISSDAAFFIWSPFPTRRIPAKI